MITTSIVVSAASIVVVAVVRSTILRAEVTLVASPTPVGSSTALAIPASMVGIIAVILVGDDRILGIGTRLCLVNGRSRFCRHSVL